MVEVRRQSGPLGGAGQLCARTELVFELQASSLLVKYIAALLIACTHTRICESKQKPHAHG